MTESRGKFSNPPRWRKRHSIDTPEWVRDAKKDSSDWEELKGKTSGWKELLRPQSPAFEELKGLLGQRSWGSLMSELERVDLNGEEDVFIDGERQDNAEPEAVYIDLASDLKEFDSEAFNRQVSAPERKWLELKAFVKEQRDDSGEFLRYAYNLKVLYPQKFLQGEFEVDEKIFQQVIDLLENLSAKENWEEFVNKYNQAVLLLGDRLKANFPIGKETVRKVFSWVNSLKKEPGAYARASAIASPILKGTMWEIKIDKDEWNSIKKEISNDLIKGVRDWDIFSKIRGLKAVKFK